MGLDSRTIYRRCLPGGPWRRLLPGIILMQGSPPTNDQRLSAALLYGGPNALVTGIEACRLHGLRQSQLPDKNDLHLIIPHEHKLQSSEFVLIERTLRLPHPVMRHGVPLAPLFRAALDGARRMRTSDPVAALLIEAVQTGRCTMDVLKAELESGGQRGTAIPRRVLGQIDRLRSVAELHGRRVSNEFSIPPTHWNTSLYDSSGNYVGCPDAWWDDVGLAWEIDSIDFHFHRHDYARTLQRNTRYAAAGITLVQTLPSRLRNEARAVIAEIEAAYRVAAGRPRPQVRIRVPN